ncbi:MAG: NAD-dependent epimerase/dehydratase family protein [Cyclobacteriaceae bacterium]|nr:NAD-dependent epimerase/dehydratase family protein [Cyclobacteriaceae bacterium]
MILITGANGFIGSYLCRELVNQGYEIRAIVRETADLSSLKDILTQIEIFKGDLLDLVRLEQAFEGITKVVHCAGKISFHPGDEKEMRSANVDCTHNLVNMALEKKISQFVHISSVAALAKDKGQEVVDENSQWPGTATYSRYGESKYLGELEVWRAHIEGLPSVIINPSIILGAGNWNESSSKLFKYVWEGNKYFTRGHLNYVDVRDVVKIITTLLQRGIIGERFIINAGKIDYQSFFSSVAKNFSTRPPSVPISKTMETIALGFEKLRTFFTGKRQRISREIFNGSRSNLLYDNRKIIKQTDFTFTPLQDTLRWACGELSGTLKNNK